MWSGMSDGGYQTRMFWLEFADTDTSRQVKRDFIKQQLTGGCMAKAGCAQTSWWSNGWQVAREEVGRSTRGRNDTSE